MPLTVGAGPVWPPPPRTIPRQGLSTGMSILFIALATALIGGGLGFIIYSATAEYHPQLSTQGTAQAQSTMQAQNTALARTQVLVQATNKALATVQAGIFATAPARVGATAAAGAVINMGTA